MLFLSWKHNTCVNSKNLFTIKYFQNSSRRQGSSLVTPVLQTFIIDYLIKKKLNQFIQINNPKFAPTEKNANPSRLRYTVQQFEQSVNFSISKHDNEAKSVPDHILSSDRRGEREDSFFFTYTKRDTAAERSRRLRAGASSSWMKRTPDSVSASEAKQAQASKQEAAGLRIDCCRRVDGVTRAAATASPLSALRSRLAYRPPRCVRHGVWRDVPHNSTLWQNGGTRYRTAESPACTRRRWPPRLSLPPSRWAFLVGEASSFLRSDDGKLSESTRRPSAGEKWVNVTRAKKKKSLGDAKICATSNFRRVQLEFVCNVDRFINRLLLSGIPRSRRDCKFRESKTAYSIFFRATPFRK